MATTREQLEKLAHDMKALADEADAKSGADAEEIQAKILVLAKQFTDAKVTYENEKQVSKALADSTSFVSSLSDLPDGVVKSIADVNTTSAPVLPRGSLGAQFVGSDSYKDFTGRYGTGADGVIPHSVKGIQSRPFQVDTKDTITGTSSTSAGAAVVNDRYSPITDLVGDRELTIADLVTNGTTTSDTVEYVRVTSKTNNASPVVEASASSGTSGVKPESALALAVVSTTVKTIAHWIPMTKRAASDAPQVRTLVDAFLRTGLEEALEDEILTGDGTGEHFTGILSTSGIGSVGSAGTDLDAIVDAIRTVRVTGRRRANAVVMHPNDFWSTGFALAKDGNDNYLLGNGIITNGASDARLWGLRLVVTEAATEGQALVGDFRQAVLWRREGVTLTVSDSHSDFFTRNLLAILAELRAAFGVLDPQAFCTVESV